MKKVSVSTTGKNYPVYIGKSILNEAVLSAAEEYSSKKILVVADENVLENHSKKIKDVFSVSGKNTFLYKLKSGEKRKSYIELNKIYSFLLKNNFGRDSLIVAIGGGVAGDLSGYAASTYMRGINLIHIPTTLLAMVDSSIGGKTGINFNTRKNIIGSFYQPEMVITDLDFLSSLPDSEITSGIGEIIKYAFLSEKKFYSYVKKNVLKIYEDDLKILEEIVLKSVKIKAGVVSQDEKEGSLRKILNLGHTFAHAFETDLNFKIKHGEAVIAGIISALFLAEKTGILTKEKLNEFIELPLKIKLSGRIKSLNNENAYSVMLSDKKNREGKIKFVLPADTGSILIDVEADKNDVLYSLSKTKEILS